MTGDKELDKMSQILFENRIFTYQNPSDIEMSVTQKLVYEAQQKAKLEGTLEGEIEGKLKAKQEMILKLLNLFQINYTQEQEKQIYLIRLEKQLDEILEVIATKKQDWTQFLKI